METDFLIMDASCGHKRGSYRRVALCEVIAGTTPKMISWRAVNMVRIVQTWENLRTGSTKRCAYQQALAEARYHLRLLVPK